MEKSLTECMRKVLETKPANPSQLSPLVLAYIGDSVFDLVIKTYLVDSKGNMQVNKLNRFASGIVKAQTQSKLIGFIEPQLTEAEEVVYKRGRNAKSYTSAKNASILDYRRATGFEALVGYLYLAGDFERMLTLIKSALDSLAED